MKDFIKKNIDWIIISILTITILILNISPDKVTMGLDNSSPFFNPIKILPRIKETSAIVFGGLIFQIPFLQTLKGFGLTPELISNIYVFGNLIVGIIGFTLLLRRDSQNKLATIIGYLILISNLFFFWIFGHPNFLFICSFGSIPILIWVLSEEKLNWKKYLLIVISSFSFLTTSLNLVAVGIYSILILILSYVLSKRKNVKRLLIWLLSIFLFWFISLQTVMLINNDKTFLPVRIYEYTQELKENPYVTESTEGIVESEKTNSLTKTARYAIGWMELHDSSNIPIFDNYETYKESEIFEILGLLPILLALVAVLIETNKENLSLTVLLGIFIFFSSKYGIYLIDKTPYLRDTLRWISSKTWPIYIIPTILLSKQTLNHLLEKNKRIWKVAIGLAISISLIIYSLPVLNGHLLSDATQIKIPKEYFEIPENSKILILPHPQKQYMRQYDWGYYGSDFLVHISNSEIIDGANLFEYAKEYEEIFETKEIPDYIDYVIYDNSAEYNLNKDLKEKSLELIKNLELIDSNEYFDTYEI